MSKAHLVATLLAGGLVFAGSAQAGLFRTYIASTGSDSNPCTLQLPCRLLPAAIAAVNSGGEIWMLDSANYNTGPVTVDRSVSILAIPGVMGSVVGNGGDAIVITSGSVGVSLRNLTILNLAGANHGINLSGGGKISIEGCEIYGFLSDGVLINGGKAYIGHSIIRNNGEAGVSMDGGVGVVINESNIRSNTGAGVVSMPSTNVRNNVRVINSVVNGNGYGVVAGGDQGTTFMEVIGTVATGNTNEGFATTDNGGPSSAATLFLRNSSATGNGTYGVHNVAGTISSDGTNNAANNNTGDVLGTITTGTQF
jgi:hypothetical protein